MASAIGWAGTRTATVSSPERPVELGRLGVESGNPHGGGEIADMGDQRVEGGAALGLIKPGDRGRIGGVGAEAIDRLGWERDQPALAKAAAGLGHGSLAGGPNPRFQV